MEFPASPAHVGDVTLDALADDAGIFFGKEPDPQEQYYQRRLNRIPQLTFTQPTPFRPGPLQSEASRNDNEEFAMPHVPLLNLPSNNSQDTSVEKMPSVVPREGEGNVFSPSTDAEISSTVIAPTATEELPTTGPSNDVPTLSTDSDEVSGPGSSPSAPVRFATTADNSTTHRNLSLPTIPESPSTPPSQEKQDVPGSLVTTEPPILPNNLPGGSSGSQNLQSSTSGRSRSDSPGGDRPSKRLKGIPETPIRSKVPRASLSHKRGLMSSAQAAGRVAVRPPLSTSLSSPVHPNSSARTPLRKNVIAVTPQRAARSTLKQPAIAGRIPISVPSTSSTPKAAPPSAKIPSQLASTSKLHSSVNKPAADFRFVFGPEVGGPSTPMHQSRTHVSQPSADIPPVPALKFKFVQFDGPSARPPARLASPSKPAPAKLESTNMAIAPVVAEGGPTSPIRFNPTLISPRKVGSPSQGNKQMSSSVYGSPVRSKTLPGPSESRPIRPLKLTVSVASTSSNVISPHGSEPRPPAPVPPKASSNALPQSVSKHSRLPTKVIVMPSGFKPVSKLPKPHPTQHTEPLRTSSATVNMVHMPSAAVAELPEKARPDKASDPPQARRKRVFRPVIPGTLTGWEGKPEPASSSDPATASDSEPIPNKTESSGDKVISADQADGVAAEQQENQVPGQGSPSSDDSSPRRSRRLSKEKPEVVPEELPGSRGRSEGPSVRRSTKSASRPRATNGFPNVDKELATITNRNTTQNQEYFVTIDRQVIRKDCPRPPSPSSRVRTLMGTEEKEKEEAKAGRMERARRRGLLEFETDDEENEGAAGKEIAKHFRGAGDEEDYETPKRRKVDEFGGFISASEQQDDEPIKPLDLGSPVPAPHLEVPDKEQRASSESSEAPGDQYVKPNSKGRFVRWNKKLVFDCEEGDAFRLNVDPSKSILAKAAKALQLDDKGNVPEAGNLPENLTKDTVIVVKYVYEDDPDPEEPLPPPPSPPKRTSKRKRN